ncbi:DUF2194 domain-containing protein [Halobacillus locisalis]|uniref:DUF2194 domain-containing protein n=1 Tax=Halobacillus locisalis TaxID=220753 RepID=A0A838CW61_9BACI|nr:DUF2194 domain-containing protein [Halobacillus locisalis]MBA2176287.1 DUF2194 domain-containing protein [Halobacillus locisalis]
MRKQTLQVSLFLFVLLIGMILLLQLIRLDLFHQWFPAKASPEKEVVTMSASESLEGETKIRVYLHQNDSDLSSGAIQNMKHALQYAKVPYEEIGVSQIEQIEPSPYTVLVLAGEHSTEWPKQAITTFVEQGGRVMVAGRFINAEWNELIGVSDVEDFEDGINGLTFNKELFPGYVDLEATSNLFSHSIADVELTPEADVHLTAEGEPLMWMHPFGQGEVMFWNTTAVTDKNMRGLMLQSLSLLPPTFVSAQAAIKVMHIDDFPSPIPYATTEEIKAEYGLTIKDFYTDIWWEDMREIGERYDFTYTGYMIGTYRDDTELEGEELREVARYPMLYFGRNLLNIGGEIGLHGYNHQSMVTADEPINPELGYRPWQDQQQMEEAVQEAQRLFKYYFPEESLKSYVPPSNVINETGLSALEQSLPELQTVGSLYIGGDEGSLEQEFEYDETYEGMYHFPRITSGYVESNDDQFLQTDVIANFGVFAHFIHPDDVLDSYRSSGRNWDDMRTSLEEMGQHVEGNYPYLEAMTQSNATKKMIQYQQSELDVSYEPERIVIKGDGIINPTTLLIRVEEGKTLEEGDFSFGSVETFSAGLYLVTLTEPKAEILVEEGGP